MTVTSYVTKSLVNHKNYKKAVESKNMLCGERASLELIAASAQKKQAESVNKKCMQSKDYKQVLEVGDIGAICVPPNLQGSTDFPYVPVMVTKTHFSKTTGGVKYDLCAQHGYLDGYFFHQMISFEPTMTAAILRIDTSRVDLRKNYVLEMPASFTTIWEERHAADVQKIVHLQKIVNVWPMDGYVEANAIVLVRMGCQ
jgi:hypothetical protein